MTRGDARGAAFLLTLFALAALRVRSLDPPAASPTPRSAELLSALTSAPRPPGTEAHARARDLVLGELSALGLEAEIQRATSVSTRWGTPYDAARVENVVARLPGRTPGKSVALLAHYDSVPNGPGAADDASGVVSLLEAARALAAGPRPRNDVVFLFSDAEEAGVLGARAFAAEHGFFKNIGLALNFDARGNRGPVALVEASLGGGALVQQFARVSPSPVASSLFPEVARYLGHETDLRPFLAASVRGMNFAFADGFAHYHAPTDDARRLDPRSLAHAAGTAQALARSFAETDLDSLAPSEVVYFDLPALGLVVYGRAWALPLAILAAIGALFLSIVSIRRRETTPRRAALALVASLVPLLLAPLAAAGLVAALRAASPVFGAFRADPYEPGPARVALALLGLAFFAASDWFFRARLSPAALRLGALGLAAILGLASALFLPGGSYLLTFPLFAALAVEFFFSRRPAETEKPKAGAALLLLLAAVPALVLFVPVPYLLFIALGLPGAAPAVASVVLVAHLLSPVLARAGALRSPKLAPLGFAACALALAASFGTNQFSPQRPRPSCLAYALDHDEKRAAWLSSDARPDAFVAALLQGEAGPPRFLLPGQGAIRHEAPAPLLGLEKPVLELLSDEPGPAKRKLRFRVRSARGAPFLLVTVTSEATVLGGVIDEKPIEEPAGFRATAEEPWGFTFQAPPDAGITWSVDVTPGAPIFVRVVDRSYELPAGLLASPPPLDLAPMPFRLAKSTFVATTAVF